MPIPYRLAGDNLCEDCNGTGADIKRTLARDKKERSATGYVGCWTCNANGRDPAAYFTWTKTKENHDGV